MEVKELMNPSVISIEPTSSAALAARLISRHNIGVLPVCGGDQRLRGVVTDRDIILRCVAAEEDPAQTMVRDIMTRNCVTVSPGDDCREATRLMSVQQVRRLPVVESGKLIGIISLADLARSRRFDMEAAQALCEISENIVIR
ncbi:MAG: CBS domain-containing protein [Lawsonibacter sp.]